MRKLTALDSNTVAAAMINALSGLPVKTVSCDNGFEFGRHKRIESALKCIVYFTAVNSPQQRGSNENLNGLVRQFFPKGRSMIHVTQLHGTEAATRLIGKRRKRYGYEAPRCLFAEKTGKYPYFVRSRPVACQTFQLAQPLFLPRQYIDLRTRLAQHPVEVEMGAIRRNGAHLGEAAVEGIICCGDALGYPEGLRG
jgi:hypothetical protein